jgi:dipeptidase E
MTFQLTPQQFKKCRLLLGSGGFGGVPGGRKYLGEQMQQFLVNAENIVFIGYATFDPKESLNFIEQHQLLPGKKIKSITDFKDQPKAILDSDAIIVFGGNTFRLLSKLYEYKLLEPIREKAMNGTPYVGASAGTNVATPTIRTTNDMPIMSPPSMDAIGLVNFQINPHYVRGAFFSQEENQYVKYAGETRDDRINEFHQENTTDVIGIPEATFLRVTEGRIVYESPVKAPARFFRKNEAAKDFEPGTDLTNVLMR